MQNACQNTACDQSTEKIDGINLNGMQKNMCKVSSLKTEAAMPYHQNMFHFPFLQCALRKSIVIGNKKVSICFWLSYLHFLRCKIVIFALSFSGPTYHYRVLAADRYFYKSVLKNLLKRFIKKHCPVVLGENLTVWGCIVSRPSAESIWQSATLLNWAGIAYLQNVVSVEESQLLKHAFYIIWYWHWFAA